MKKLNIEDMNRIAQEQGGECLSSIYVNSVTKLRWRCRDGHEWEAVPSSIRNTRSWCPSCGAVRRAMASRGSIEACRILAREQGGTCLSTTYTSNSTKLLWKCAKGHEWLATPGNIQQRRWCPSCGSARGGDSRRGSIENCLALAKARGGECLSATYANDYTKLLWRCNQGHEWEATPGGIKQDHWCPYCSERKVWSPGLSEKEARLEECRAFARKQGGACLGANYLGALKKHRWRCKDGHEWEAMPSSIINAGTWCPTCREWLNEGLCRRILEAITGKDWPKARPDWLISERGGRLELDGFCQSIAVAFEYQGKQHYEFIPHFHVTEKALGRRQADDQQKRDLCARKNVKLIEIPHNVEPDKLLGFLARCLSEVLGKAIKVPPGLTMDSLGCGSGKLDECRVLAEQCQGQFLATTYLGNHANHFWRCSSGHEWKATPHNVKAGKWCPFCINKKVWSPGMSEREARLEECRALAKGHGGECLSLAYSNNSTKLQWRCLKEHEWEAQLSSVKQGGHWCPYCSGRKVWSPGLTEREARLEECRSIARSHGGACVSTDYVNAVTKLHWQCSEGHKWEATPNKVKSRREWCPFCPDSH